MKTRNFKVTFWVEAFDAAAAIKAARDQAESVGCKRSSVRDTRDAVHFLIDNVPAEERPGIAINESECEEVSI